MSQTELGDRLTTRLLAAQRAGWEFHPTKPDGTYLVVVRPDGAVAGACGPMTPERLAEHHAQFDEFGVPPGE